MSHDLGGPLWTQMGHERTYVYRVLHAVPACSWETCLSHVCLQETDGGVTHRPQQSPPPPWGWWGDGHVGSSSHFSRRFQWLR